MEHFIFTALLYTFVFYILCSFVKFKPVKMQTTQPEPRIAKQTLAPIFEGKEVLPVSESIQSTLEGDYPINTSQVEVLPVSESIQSTLEGDYPINTSQVEVLPVSESIQSTTKKRKPKNKKNII